MIVTLFRQFQQKLKHMSLEDKLFSDLLIFAMFLSVLNFVLNVSIGFRFDANYKWFAFFVTSAISLFLQFNDRYISLIRNVIFFEIIFVFLPNGWLVTKGNAYASIAYVFLIAVLINIVLEGKNRMFFLASEIIMVIVLLFYEFWTNTHGMTENSSVFQLDALLQVPVALFASIYILVLYTNAYRKEGQQLQEYSKLLEVTNKDLTEIAITDELTQVYNRRYIFMKLNEIKKHLDLIHYPVWVAIVDIDNFKTINDAFGHLVGDKVLVHVSGAMKRIVGNHGYVGRYGGDEFVIIFNDISHSDSKLIMESIKEEVREIKWDQPLQISLSGGVSRFYPTDDIDDVLNRADEMLYHVKLGAKNDIISEHV